VAFRADSQALATGSDDKTIKIWSTAGTVIKTLTGHTASVNALDYASTGGMLASGSTDKIARTWCP
jgi:WD40 repeat protein